MLLKRNNNLNQPLHEEKIIQFGEGNFLRAFVDWMVEEMNEKAGFNGSIVVVQPIENGMVGKLNEQDGLFHLVLKGLKNGEAVKETKLIRSISRGINPYENFDQFLALAINPSARIIVSNTTEAGITFDANDKFTMEPPGTFPAKLTRLLFHRYQCFNGQADKGFIILPCELIENNAIVLKDCILKYCKLWQLDPSFVQWVQQSNTFCNTLVDRIVPGFSLESSKDILDTTKFEDNLCVDAEQFHLWVIEGPDWIKAELPVDKAKLNVLFVKDIKPYRTRKVRILNGPHTIMTPIAYLAGVEFVREAVEHPVIGHYILDTIFDEIIPTLDLPKTELQNFANEVLERFKNPFVKHALMSISLNSVSKFKTRVLPTLKTYVSKYNKLPENIVISLAALLIFYSGKYAGKTIKVQDDENIVGFFSDNWTRYENKSLTVSELVNSVLRNEGLWGEDLTLISNLTIQTTKYLNEILNMGMMKVLEKQL